MTTSPMDILASALNETPEQAAYRRRRTEVLRLRTNLKEWRELSRKAVTTGERMKAKRAIDHYTAKLREMGVK